MYGSFALCLYNSCNVLMCFRSIHGVANLLRVLWACIRWDDMNTKPPSSGANISTNDHDITTREILDRKSTGHFKLQTLYKVRTIVIPLDFMEQPTRTGQNDLIDYLFCVL